MGQADTGLPPQRPRFDLRLSMWVLWWKSDMCKFSSKHFSFPLSMLFHKCSILTKSPIIHSQQLRGRHNHMFRIESSRRWKNSFFLHFKFCLLIKCVAMMLLQNISKLITEIICCSRIVHRQLFSMFTFYSSPLLWLSIHPSP
jgi:hypothetical protein